MQALRRAAARYLDWFCGAALPLWAEKGWDRGRGGFYEALTRDGAPAPEPFRRVRVQCRQIHVFAEAHARGWLDRGAAIAGEGFAYLLEHACPDEGRRGCVHRLSPEGAVLDDRRDLYDQAFLILAGASVARFAPEGPLLAGRTLAFLDRELAAPSGGYLEDDRGALPRRQNPHMHLFEATLALARATGDQHAFARADAIATLFCDRFFDRDKGVLREFFTADLAPAPGAVGRIVDPGHMVEWAWLYDRYSGMRAASLVSLRRALVEGAARIGADPASGFLTDAFDPAESDAPRPRRLWPQTEFLKALIGLAREGDDEAGAAAAWLIDALFEGYLAHPTKGLWIDRFDGAGRAIDDATPASILYHLYGAAEEAERYLMRQEPAP